MRWRAAVSISSSLPSSMKRRAASTVSSRSSPSSGEPAKPATIASRALRCSRRLASARSSRPACSAASRSRSAASSRGRQHALYFLPLPQGQRSLRPGLAIGVERLPSEDASLYATLLADARFHDLLLAVDRDLAEACRTEGCACGGRRHVARYARKPRGRPCRLGPEHDQRFSFCCAVDGCRSRATPPSLRFLGRRVYVATVVVLIAILRDGVSDARLERLSEVVSVDRRTIARWRRWWRDTFTATPFWRVARAGFMPPPDGAQLPAALIDRFGGDAQDRLVALLRFLGPVTGGARMRAF